MAELQQMLITCKVNVQLITTHSWDARNNRTCTSRKIDEMQKKKIVKKNIERRCRMSAGEIG